jgi:hypothetical protein
MQFYLRRVPLLFYQQLGSRSTGGDGAHQPLGMVRAGQWRAPSIFVGMSLANEHVAQLMGNGLYDLLRRAGRHSRKSRVDHGKRWASLGNAVEVFIVRTQFTQADPIDHEKPDVVTPILIDGFLRHRNKLGPERSDAVIVRIIVVICLWFVFDVEPGVDLVSENLIQPVFQNAFVRHGDIPVYTARERPPLSPSFASSS